MPLLDGLSSPPEYETKKEAVREVFRSHYRQHWSRLHFPSVYKVLANVPNMFIADDNDVSARISYISPVHVFWLTFSLDVYVSCVLRWSDRK